MNGSTKAFAAGIIGLFLLFLSAGCFLFVPDLLITVDIPAVEGVTVPDVDEEDPSTVVTETAQYTGTVSWSPDDDDFRYSTVYTATITLTPKTGYTLIGVPQDFFSVAGADTVTNNADSGVITAVFPKTLTTIDTAAVEGVTVPSVEEEDPSTVVTETAQYTGTVAWSPDDDGFRPSTVYTATITLTPKTGYSFVEVPQNFFTVAGADTVTNDADSGVVTAVFPETETPVDIAAVGGVTIPDVQAEESPSTVVTETDQYTGTVAWSPDHSGFGYSTVYTATITLTPKTGYTFTDVTQDFLLLPEHLV
jgi:hypothetical protein